MKQTLVIGAAGFVGKYLTKELEGNGHRVYAADIPELNILDVDSLEKKFSETTFDYVVNLAAISSVGASWKDPIATLEVNVRGTLNILNAVQKHCPKAKVLLVGSAEEYAPKDTPLNENDKLEASNPYGITKVNLRKAFRQKTAAKDLYSRVDVLPLRLPATVALPENPRLDVADNLLFLPDASGEQIVVLDTDGAFVTTVSAGAPETADYYLLKYTL